MSGYSCLLLCQSGKEPFSPASPQGSDTSTPALENNKDARAGRQGHHGPISMLVSTQPASKLRLYSHCSPPFVPVNLANLGEFRRSLSRAFPLSVSSGAARWRSHGFQAALTVVHVQLC